MYVANSAFILLEALQDFQHCNWSTIQWKIQHLGHALSLFDDPNTQ